MEMALSGFRSTSSRGKYKIWLFTSLNVICAEFEDSVVCFSISLVDIFVFGFSGEMTHMGPLHHYQTLTSPVMMPSSNKTYIDTLFLLVGGLNICFAVKVEALRCIIRKSSWC